MKIYAVYFLLFLYIIYYLIFTFYYLYPVEICNCSELCPTGFYYSDKELKCSLVFDVDNKNKKMALFMAPLLPLIFIGYVIEYLIFLLIEISFYILFFSCFLIIISPLYLPE